MRYLAGNTRLARAGRSLCALHPRLVADTGPHFDHVPSLNRVVPSASEIAAESGESAPPTRLCAMCSTPPRVIIKACAPSPVYSVSHDLVSNLVIMRRRGKPAVTRNLRASHHRGWFPSLRGARPRWRAMEDRHHTGYPAVTTIGRWVRGTGGNFSSSYDFCRKLPALRDRTVVLRLGWWELCHYVRLGLYYMFHTLELSWGPSCAQWSDSGHPAADWAGGTVDWAGGAAAFCCEAGRRVRAVGCVSNDPD
jgi:hypothetical protein